MEREKGKENSKMPLICENKCLGCFLPRAAGCGAHIPCEGKQACQGLSWHIWRGDRWCLSSTARHHCPKSCCSLGVQPATQLHQPISRQDRALGRGGKAGEGKCFIRDTAFSFIHNSDFMSSLQKAVQRTIWEKPTQRVHSRQAKAKSGYFG